MEKWEYDVVSVSRFGPGDTAEETSFLNTYGADGWCLVTVVDGAAYFRRPITKPKPPPVPVPQMRS